MSALKPTIIKLIDRWKELSEDPIVIILSCLDFRVIFPLDLFIHYTKLQSLSKDKQRKLFQVKCEQGLLSHAKLRHLLLKNISKAITTRSGNKMVDLILLDEIFENVFNEVDLGEFSIIHTLNSHQLEILDNIFTREFLIVRATSTAFRSLMKMFSYESYVTPLIDFYPFMIKYNSLLNSVLGSYIQLNLD
uniref:Uncharacterized protein n=1 Tax=Pithovirus LCPAC401 TaxID=2506595 RepID=A0A481Z9C3_9VIRU|nr:MAG: hypothetical protein LCPAC401_01410 [Pithovirus LCPAC401]